MVGRCGPLATVERTMAQRVTSMQRARGIATALVGGLLLGIAAAAAGAPPSTAVVLAADPSPSAAASPVPHGLPDLSGVVIAPADLPPGFEPSEAETGSFTALAHALAGKARGSRGAEDHNATVLQLRTGGGAEFVTMVLVAPLSPEDQAAFDATVQQARRLVVETVADTLGDAEVTVIEGMRTGASRFAVAISMPDNGVEYRAVAARRGPVLEVVGHAWTKGVEPTTSLAEAAAIVDARLAAATGPEAPVYRPAGPLVPVITTHIPAPQDLSTDPAVVGTNVLLAAIALLLLTVSSKAATRLLADHEAAIARRVPLVGAIGRLEARLATGAGGRLGRRRLRDLLGLLGVTLFYGVLFSLLEPGWEPLTVTGMWLLVSFTTANAVVGMGDDLAAWAVARRWGLPASLAVRPTTALLAVGSVGLSRAASVVPGLMFGTPEALQLPGELVDRARSRRLALIGVVVLAAVGGVAWAITMGTTAIAREGEMTNGLAGIEALLLLVFASSLQNLFVGILGFRGSAGEMLRERSRLAWAVVAVAITFLFFHTLLNPQGDPAMALSNRNVQVTMGLVVAFSLVTGAAWVVDRLAARPEAAARAPAAPGSTASAGQSTEVRLPAPAGRPAPAGVLAPPPTHLREPASATTYAAPVAVYPVASYLAPVGLPGAVSAWTSIPTADGDAGGRAWFASAGGVVIARTELIDPLAVRQYHVLVVLAAVGLGGPLLAGALAEPGGGVSDMLAAGALVLVAMWLLLVAGGRAWLRRYRVVHTAVFPVQDVAAVDVGRDLGLGCLLTILLSPLIGLLYLAVTGGRVVRITAPLAADRSGAVRLRCKGSEAEALAVRRVLLGGQG